MVSSKILQEVSYSTVLATAMAILFAIYGPKLSTELPDSVRVVFENNIARFAVMVIIVYLGNHNVQLSLVIALCIVLIMSYVHKYEIKEELTNKIHEDFYTKTKMMEPYIDFKKALTDGMERLHVNIKNITGHDTLGKGLLGEGLLGEGNETFKVGNKEHHEKEHHKLGRGGTHHEKEHNKLGPGGTHHEKKHHKFGPGGTHQEEEEEEGTNNNLGPGGTHQEEEEEEGTNNNLGPDGTYHGHGSGDNKEEFVNYRMNQLQNIEHTVQSMVNTYKMVG
jgi:hypothetical protein